jgi:hypothetical protein
MSHHDNDCHGCACLSRAAGATELHLLGHLLVRASTVSTGCVHVELKCMPSLLLQECIAPEIAVCQICCAV